jgi:hypothetical protein
MEFDIYAVSGDDVTKVIALDMTLSLEEIRLVDWYEPNVVGELTEIIVQTIDDVIYWLYNEKEWQEARVVYFNKRVEVPWLCKDDKERKCLGKISREARDAAEELEKDLENAKTLRCILDVVDALYCGISLSKTKVLEKYRDKNLKLF